MSFAGELLTLARRGVPFPFGWFLCSSRSLLTQRVSEKCHLNSCAVVEQLAAKNFLVEMLSSLLVVDRVQPVCDSLSQGK